MAGKGGGQKLSFFCPPVPHSTQFILPLQAPVVRQNQVHPDNYVDKEHGDKRSHGYP